VLIIRRLNCFIEHLVSSHSVGGRPVRWLITKILNDIFILYGGFYLIYIKILQMLFNVLDCSECILLPPYN